MLLFNAVKDPETGEVKNLKTSYVIVQRYV